MTNPLIDATNNVLAHLDTLQAGTVVEKQFISDHRTLVENLQNLIDTFLIESYHAQEGYRALQATLMQKSPSEPNNP